MEDKYLKITAEKTEEIKLLVDEKSELRYTGKHKLYMILVDKECPNYGSLIVKGKDGYIEVCLRKRQSPGNYSIRSFGRFLTGLTDRSKVIDHINGNTLDNRMCNLRICDAGKNIKNRKPYSLKTRYKGLNIGNDNKVIFVEIQNEFKRTRVYLGRELIEKIGAIIYDCMAIQQHADYSRLNFKDTKYSDDVVMFILDLIKDNISVGEHKNHKK